MTKFRDSIAGCVVILAAICLVVTTALAGTNALTKGIIEEAIKVANAGVYKEIMPNITTVDPLDIELPVGVSDASLVEGIGYVFTATARGYNGNVSFAVATDLEGNYTGIKMLEGNSETQGFGSRVGEPEYLEKYYGENSPGSVDALSGATVTSGALKKVLELVDETYALAGGLK